MLVNLGMTTSNPDMTGGVTQPVGKSIILLGNPFRDVKTVKRTLLVYCDATLYVILLRVSSHCQI